MEHLSNIMKITKRQLRSIIRESIREGSFSDMDIEAMEKGTGRYATPQKGALTSWEEKVINYLKNELGIEEVEWNQGSLYFNNSTDHRAARDHFNDPRFDEKYAALRPPKSSALVSIEDTLEEYIL